MGRRPLLGVAGGADPHDLVADLDAEPDDEDDAMRRGIQDLPRRRDQRWWRHPQHGIVAALDVRKDDLQRAA
jgi:hypothetical protein